MKKEDLNNVKLPLAKKKFMKLRDAIRAGKVKWMDMSKELMFSYQDFWKSQNQQSIE